MRRLIWSQLRFRRGRALALLAGMLVAVTAFTVLTAASRTSQLRTIGTVRQHFRSAYDILVRPRGSRTKLESQTGTVQPNFLSGIYGGITTAQWHKIQRIPGVQVAAPIAMAGYLLPSVPITVRLPAAAAKGHDRQLYRVSTTWVSAGGSERIPDAPQYVYMTSHRITGQFLVYEHLRDGSKAHVCDGVLPSDGTRPPGHPFPDLFCWSRVSGNYGTGRWENLTARHPGYAIVWQFPMLVAAIDPVAEARLDGLNRAVTSGRYLSEDAGFLPGAAADDGGELPVLAASSSGLGENAAIQVQRLPDPRRPPLLDIRQMQQDESLPGRTVAELTISAGQAYRQLLSQFRGIGDWALDPAAYWNVGPTTYRRGHDGSLTARTVQNPESVWSIPWPGEGQVAPVDEAATAFRQIHEHENTTNAQVGQTPEPHAVGLFDPAKIRSFDPLSAVPLGPFEPTAAAPAGAASRRALGGHDLLPSLNMGGYVSQPVQLITTLSALPGLENSVMFRGDLHAADPISAIRVRVAGVTGPSKLSLARIRQVAQQIATSTHLTVDIVTGSSPTPTTVSLPAGKYGQPALRVTEGWVRKGVAVAILSAVDKTSVVLFTLVLVVCALFVANSATAAVRGRRRELGVLACLGWTRPRIFATVLGELAMIGLLAGSAGAALALPLSAALQLHASPSRALLAIPAAVALSVLAGAIPAWLASRSDPVAAVRPPVLAIRRSRHPRGITGLAVANVLRTPGRTLVAAASLAVGVGALTMLTAVTLAFRGTVVGSLLGNAVAVQIRGTDYVAVAATVVLGVVTVADALFLNIRERAAELATIRVLGWPESALTRLVVTECAAIGLAGSLAGAAAGLGAAAWFAGQFPARLLFAAAAAVLAGMLVTTAAALLPAWLLRRLPAAQLLAEE